MLSGQAAGEQGGWSGAEPLGVGVLRDPGKGPQGWHVADIMGLDGHWGVHEPNGASPRSSQRCRVVGERAGTLVPGLGHGLQSSDEPGPLAAEPAERRVH